MSDHDEEGYPIRHYPLVLVTDIGSVFFGVFVHLECECSGSLPSLHILDEADSELVPLTTVDSRLDIVFAREICLHLFPFWMLGVDDVLSFDFFGHMLGIRI